LVLLLKLASLVPARDGRLQEPFRQMARWLQTTATSLEGARLAKSRESYNGAAK
jgi:hypothetical protein